MELLQGMGKCPAHFWKAALFPDTPVEQLGSRRSLGHSLPLLSFLFPLLTEMILLANSVSVAAVNSSPCSGRLDLSQTLFTVQLKKVATNQASGN